MGGLHIQYIALFVLPSIMYEAPNAELFVITKLVAIFNETVNVSSTINKAIKLSNGIFIQFSCRTVSELSSCFLTRISLEDHTISIPDEKYKKNCFVELYSIRINDNNNKKSSL